MSALDSAPPGFNYAKYFGIESTVAAAVFVVLYAPLLVFYIWKSFGRPCYVYIMLGVFSLMRVVALVMRCLLASSEAAGENKNLLIANQVIFNVGFFALLFSAYTLVLDREEVSDGPVQNNIFANLMRNRKLYRIIISIGTALSIYGFIKSDTGTGSEVSTGLTLRKAGTIIFLVLTLLYVVETFFLWKQERTVEAESSYSYTHRSIGAKHGLAILGTIGGFLVIREVFFTATLWSPATQQNEHYWYPLVVIPEFLVVCLFGTPGLVPPKEVDRVQKEIPMYNGSEYAGNQNQSYSGYAGNGGSHSYAPTPQ